MQLGHTVEADNRWRVFAFAGAGDQGQPGGGISALCKFLETSAASPVLRHTGEGVDADAVIDVRAVFQQGFRDLEHGAMPRLLRPHKGIYRLCDYEKVFCANLKSGEDIFEMRQIDRDHGCVVIVRPDQYVAHVLLLSAHDALTAFFAGVLLPAEPALDANHLI